MFTIKYLVNGAYVDKLNLACCFGLRLKPVFANVTEPKKTLLTLKSVESEPKDNNLATFNKVNKLFHNF